MMASKLAKATSLIHQPTHRTFIPTSRAALHKVISLEPFPEYSEPPAQVIAISQELQAWPHIHRKRASTLERFSDELRLRHYRFEVTFGLYMMTMGEKLILTAIVPLVLTSICYAFHAALASSLWEIGWWLLCQSAALGERAMNALRGG